MKKIIALLTGIFAAGLSFGQVKLEYKYKADDNFRVLSTTEEDVYFDGIPSHHAQITNRVSVRITGIDEKGRGIHEAHFMASENSSAGTKSRSWGEEYDSVYVKDAKGKMEIEDIYFMPVVRDVPSFPDKILMPGESWTAEGHEAHDLRRSFDIKTPFKVPFTAKYTYLRDEDGISSDSAKTKKTFQVIQVNYQLFFESPAEVDYLNQADVPVSTMGYANQTIWWDNEKGQVDHYTENFRIVIETSRGHTFNFKGTTLAENTEFKRTATEEKVEEVMEKIQDLGIENVDVKKTDKGLTISVEKIQFKPNSSVLEESEQEKLKLISQILAGYPDNDLLVTGHTARVGTPESCQVLSEERARSVADFLVGLGTKEAKHVFTLGVGARVPVATNETTEGRTRNRRVEITILDK